MFPLMSPKFLISRVKKNNILFEKQSVSRKQFPPLNIKLSVLYKQRVLINVSILSVAVDCSRNVPCSLDCISMI
jgi:hypothetical protein